MKGRNNAVLPVTETEMLAVDDMIDAEEALRQEEDEGQKLEPFNLAKERQEGRFDESGMYVENKEEEDPTLQDAWLTSTDGEPSCTSFRSQVLHLTAIVFEEGHPGMHCSLSNSFR